MHYKNAIALETPISSYLIKKSVISIKHVPVVRPNSIKYSGQKLHCNRNMSTRIFKH